MKCKDKLNKMGARWEHGIFVGIKRRSGECWISTKEKVEAVRAVRRVPVE